MNENLFPRLTSSTATCGTGSGKAILHQPGVSHGDIGVYPDLSINGFITHHPGTFA
jgi:hypothetical protein